MPMFDPGQRLAEEQDYVQAYENVREKYKGNNAPRFFSSSVVFTLQMMTTLRACLNGVFGVRAAVSVCLLTGGNWFCIDLTRCTLFQEEMWKQEV